MCTFSCLVLLSTCSGLILISSCSHTPCHFGIERSWYDLSSIGKLKCDFTWGVDRSITLVAGSRKIDGEYVWWLRPDTVYVHVAKTGMSFCLYWDRWLGLWESDDSQPPQVTRFCLLTFVSQMIIAGLTPHLSPIFPGSAPLALNTPVF